MPGRHAGFLHSRASQIGLFRVLFTINNLSYYCKAMATRLMDSFKQQYLQWPIIFSTRGFVVEDVAQETLGAGKTLAQRVWDAALRRACPSAGWHYLCLLQRLGCMLLAQEGRRENLSSWCHGEISLQEGTKRLNSSRVTLLQHKVMPGSILGWGMASPPGTLTFGLSKWWHRLSSSCDMCFSNDPGNVIKIVLFFF